MTGWLSFSGGPVCVCMWCVYVWCVCVCWGASVPLEVGTGTEVSRQLGPCPPSEPSFFLPQAWSFPTSPHRGATSLTSTRPSRPARSRTRWWPLSSSCSGPGRRAWTGATRAGWRMPRYSTPSRGPDSPVAAWAWPPACAAMAHATAACTAMTCSASPLPSRVSGVAEHGLRWAGNAWGASGAPCPPWGTSPWSTADDEAMCSRVRGL